jgi:hypothetical protein
VARSRKPSEMKKYLCLLILAFAVISPLTEPHLCYANAAAPPSVIIIVQNGPADLEITLWPDNIKADRTDKAIESYFAFYSYMLTSSSHTLQVSSRTTSFAITLESLLYAWENVYTLDLKNQTLTPGKSVSLMIAVAATRIIVTLAIEGLVFLLFGYRNKKSWMIFLVINLTTQGFLTFTISTNTNPLNSYLIFGLVLVEFLIFIVETIAFMALINEHRRLRTFFYVIAANFASLIAGSLLLSVLPI